MQAAVETAISAMRTRYCEQITLPELAAEVFVSPFHFLRVFAKETGVTPGRYLTAVRMFEAKRLLLTTSRTVADIVCSVGYSSVGTFTSRFTRAVGMTPTQYRDPEVGRLLVAVSPDFHHLPSLEDLHQAGKHCSEEPAPGTASISGTIELPAEAAPANILVGVFSESFPQCGPVAHQYLPNVGSARLAINDVPAGRWVIIAVAEHIGSAAADSPIYLGTVRQPATVAAGGTTSMNLRMRAVRPTDPPFAITLASRVSGNSGLAGARQREALPVAA